MIHIEIVPCELPIFWQCRAKSLQNALVATNFHDYLIVILVTIFAHMDVPGIGVPCAASGLNVLDQGCVEIKSNDKIAIWYVESFLCNTSGKQNIDYAFAKIHHHEDLLSERHVQVSSITSSCSDLSCGQ
jgi:hypothetical protein